MLRLGFVTIQLHAKYFYYRYTKKTSLRQSQPSKLIAAKTMQATNTIMKNVRVLVCRNLVYLMKCRINSVLRFERENYYVG